MPILRFSLPAFLCPSHTALLYLSLSHYCSHCHLSLCWFSLPPLLLALASHCGLSLWPLTVTSHCCSLTVLLSLCPSLTVLPLTVLLSLWPLTAGSHCCLSLWPLTITSHCAGAIPAAAFVMKESTAQALQTIDQASPAIKLLDTYFRKAPEGANRFKLLGKVRNWSEAGLPTALASYNGKPVQVSKSGQWIKPNSGRDYAELDINLGHWAFLARKGLWSAWGSLGRAVLDFGMAIESREESTTPENVLGCCTFRNIDLSNTSKLPNWEGTSSQDPDEARTWSCHAVKAKAAKSLSNK